MDNPRLLTWRSTKSRAMAWGRTTTPASGQMTKTEWLLTTFAAGGLCLPAMNDNPGSISVIDDTLAASCHHPKAYIAVLAGVVKGCCPVSAVCRFAWSCPRAPVPVFRQLIPSMSCRFVHADGRPDRVGRQRRFGRSHSPSVRSSRLVIARVAMRTPMFSFFLVDEPLSESSLTSRSRQAVTPDFAPDPRSLVSRRDR